MTNVFLIFFFVHDDRFYPYHLYISIYFLHILFYKYFPLYWEGKFIEQSKLPGLAIISFILIILMNDSSVLLDAGHCQGLKG